MRSHYDEINQKTIVSGLPLYLTKQGQQRRRNNYMNPEVLKVVIASTGRSSDFQGMLNYFKQKQKGKFR